MANSAFNQSQSPYSSESAAGLVEEATQAQVDSKTDTGETGAKLFVPPSKVPSASTSLYLADESITAGDAVALKLPTLTPVVAYSMTAETATAGFNLVNNLAWYARKYTASALASQLKKITLKIQMGITSGTLEVRIRQGSPTGSTVYTYTTHNYAASETSVDIKDNINLAISPGVDYYICVLQTVTPGGTDANRRRLLGQTVVASSNTLESSDSGASFANSTFDMYLIVEENQINGLEKVVKASASALAEALNFVGFAKNTVTAGQAVNIDFNALPSVTGAAFTVGAVYYLSNTPGALSVAPGTIQRLVGRATGASSLIRARGLVSKHISTGGNFTSPVHGQVQYFNSAGVYITVDGVDASFNLSFTSSRQASALVRPGSVVTFANGGGGGTYGPTIQLLDYGNII